MTRDRLPSIGAALALAAAALLAGCAVPAAQPGSTPALELPTASAPTVAVATDWWQSFADPRLDALVDEALQHNRDLARAMARIDESRAALRAAHAERLPSLSAGASALRARSSENSPAAVPGAPRIANDFGASVTVAYEVDLWSRTASLNAAARDELLAGEYARDTLRTALAAQVVQSYAALQALDAQVRLYGDAVQAQRDSLALQRRRFDAGDISELDIRQLEAELIDNEAQLPKLDRARGEAERALALVLGRSPKALVEGAIARGDAGTLRAGGVPEGLPSDLLLHRPDVHAAEARLRAAGVRVAAARAAYFPGIALTASYGRESTALSRLFDGPSTVWNVAAALTQPIWDGGRIGAQFDAAQARRAQAELDYRDNVAIAFKEVRDALGAYTEASATFASGQRRASALQRAADLTRLRYDGGESSRLDVINAERLALGAQAQNADAARAVAAAQANVFRALGGGWTPAPLR
ncbi:MAG: efflux transporter outer membrane subunit [Ideonella sp.]|nr:efflux transporter outer membrane subunit [Ideonella sp.]MCC7458431.1 efflux transporter outer membrane subunit [Nitrospira sp.]